MLLIINSIAITTITIAITAIDKAFGMVHMSKYFIVEVSTLTSLGNVNQTVSCLARNYAASAIIFVI